MGTRAGRGFVPGVALAVATLAQAIITVYPTWPGRWLLKQLEQLEQNYRQASTYTKSVAQSKCLVLPR